MDPVRLMAELQKRGAVKVAEKSAEVTTTLREALLKRIFFRSLKPDALDAVVSAMTEVAVKEGDVVNAFCVVLSGALVQDGEQPTTHEAGSCVGEAALMQEACRGAVLTAVRDCVLYTLDRPTFRALLVQESTSGKAAALRRPLCVTFELLPAPVRALEAADPDALLSTKYVAPTLRMDGANVARPDDWRGEVRHMIIPGVRVLTRHTRAGPPSSLSSGRVRCMLVAVVGGGRSRAA